MSTITSLLIALRHLDYLPWMLTAADSVVILFNVKFRSGRFREIVNTIKSIQKIHNPDLDIEGLC
jgi:hypothetical protein